MTDYYIKYIYGPRGRIYPDKENLIHFAEGQEKTCEYFKNCLGFLLYETGGKNSKEGTMKIYAYGFIDSNQPSYIVPIKSGGRSFPYAVKVKLHKRVDPQDGIPLSKIRKITGVKGFQRKGGLLGITKEQFDELRSELDKHS